MKRHAGSRQKPVPKTALIPIPGLSFPKTLSFIEGLIFAEVIGTTVLLKSAQPEGDARVEGLGVASCAIARERQEHAIRS